MGFRLRPIVPQKLDARALVSEMVESVREEAGIHKRLFGRTTRTWRTSVSFTISVSLRPQQITGSTFTYNQIFRFVELGTQPHVITPRRAPMLSFRRNYAPKTRVGQLLSVRGGSSGNFVHARRVMHPGTDGRHFGQAIVLRRQNPFVNATRRRLQREIARQQSSPSRIL